MVIILVGVNIGLVLKVLLINVLYYHGITVVLVYTIIKGQVLV